jgi:hypothetical protein
VRIKKEWLLVIGSVLVTLVVALGMVRWFAPQLLGIPVDLQMVRVSKEVPPFFDNIFRPEDFQSDNFIISDPFIMRAKPLLRGFAEMGPNDLLGFRNRSIPNIADIITIGDSQTYGNNVYMEQNWPSSLAAVMDDNLPTLYNMSVGGWGAAEYFEIFNKALHFEPKVVVIAFYTGNDPLDTFMKVYGDVRWKSLRLDPKLKASDTPVVPEYNIWEITFEDGQSTILVPNYRNISNRDHPVVRAGYEIMGKIAVKIGELARHRDIKLVFTVIPTKELAFKKKIELEKIKPIKDYVALVTQEERNIENFGKVLNAIPGAVYVDVLSPLQEAVLSSDSIYTSDIDGHPKAAGYSVIGNTLAETVQKLLPEKPAGAVWANISEDKLGLFLVLEDKLWIFETDEIAEANGWTDERIEKVELIDVSSLPYGGIISEVDPGRYGPGVFGK